MSLFGIVEEDSSGRPFILVKEKPRDEDYISFEEDDDSDDN